jgi:hypothetical protein
MQISATGILATIPASAGQNGHFSKVGTVYVYLLFIIKYLKLLIIENTILIFQFYK